uniref:TPA-induced transmembrane protein n=1 Tax=Nomascus leucogenys TaxID=61853 RepID=G1QVX4_NOMLE
MDPARPSPPVDELELSVLERQPEEHTPLNGADKVFPSLNEEAPPAEANKESPWSFCNKNVFGRCKLWMIITSIFLGVIIVIIIGLYLAAVTYVDEDESEILELSSNKTFFVMLKIPEECVAQEELPHLLTEREVGLKPNPEALVGFE